MSERPRSREELSESLRSWDAHVGRSPNDAKAHAARGLLLWSLERHADALNAMQRAFKLDPLDPEIRKQRADLILRYATDRRIRPQLEESEEESLEKRLLQDPE